MLIRRLKIEDAAECYAIESATFSDPWSLESFEKEANAKDHIYLVAEDDGAIAGYCGCWNVCGEGQIYNVAVREDMRGKGLGRKLMTEILKEGEEAGITAFTLEVRLGNEPAKALYHSLGFEDAGIRKNFYESPTEDAIIMWRK